MSAATFDFLDGKGPVPAHHHVNGGGWVADTAHVDNTAYVGLDARVYGTARVSGTAQVYGNARVSENAWVSGTAQVSGDAQVSVSPICLTGGEYLVTITDRHVQVGCHCHTTEEWRTLTPQAAPFLESIREHVLEIAALHQARVKEEGAK